MGHFLLYGATMRFWKKKQAEQQPADNERVSRGGLFSTHAADGFTGSQLAKARDRLVKSWNSYLSRNAPRPQMDVAGATMDDADSWNNIKDAYTIGQPSMSDALFNWFGSQSFIGHQACAILAQHWMINKICTIPGRDAVRQGYEITNAPGQNGLDEKVLAAYAHYDKAFGIVRQMEEFVRFGRIFGIRVVIPLIESGDPDYYEKPFNPDGVMPNSYKGMSQVDPYWMSPILSAEAAAQPDAPDFYEPTWWLINGRRYHRSHLIIFRTAQPADILKPAYLYSGIPITQQIMERVYGAERCANEAPLLLLTKRLFTMKLADIEAAYADKERFDAGMQQFIENRDNYGVRITGVDDEINQSDTSLADLADVIKSQFELACAAGGIPVNKVMGTAAGGLSNEGAYDESNYGQDLESLQTHDLSPMLQRHHLLVRRSFLIPQFGDAAKIETEISWMPIDSPTAKEYAEINELNARADLSLKQTGAISDADINSRLRNDKNSGYSTIRPIMEGEREPEVPGADDPLNLDPDADAQASNDRS